LAKIVETRQKAKGFHAEERKDFNQTPTPVLNLRFLAIAIYPLLEKLESRAFQ
jgi:hypothetical protein